ncbi:WecB/TagA/CpsF family glycosyltransferase [Pseudarthrobacter sp. L19]|uniref:WecB/TagA/CpsF family glycosyltransferase n=1 Tax=Pseudarthrobacter sp. L19 TaxID=3423951 RepID=UPI003D7B3BCC
MNSAADEPFRRAFNRSDIAMVDGISLSLISALTPGVRLHKMATTDFAPAVFRRAARTLGRPVRVAIIGGTEDVSKGAAEALNRETQVNVVYSTHGYWPTFTEPIERLNRLDLDILILGLGMPLEAHWLAEYQTEIDVPLVITCGGWLRLLAGIEHRAPILFQVIHLEWLWRLTTDRKRTAKRYGTGLVSVANALVGHWKW